jgi:hypothetical protein
MPMIRAQIVSKAFSLLFDIFTGRGCWPGAGDGSRFLVGTAQLNPNPKTQMGRVGPTLAARPGSG